MLGIAGAHPSAHVSKCPDLSYSVSYLLCCSPCWAVSKWTLLFRLMLTRCFNEPYMTMYTHCCRCEASTTHVVGLNKASMLTSGDTSEASTSQPGSPERPQAVLLLSVAQQMLLDQSKALDTASMAAFTKALSCVALHLESGAAMGCLSLVNRVLRYTLVIP